MGRKRRQYTDEFRSSAVLMLEAAGYPERPGALMTVASYLNIPHATISRWARSINNPPPPELVHEKRIDLVSELTDLLGLTFGAAKETVGEASYKELATAIGIFVDKIQLLTGKPTERAEVNVSDHRERVLADIARRAAGYEAGEPTGIHSRPIG